MPESPSSRPAACARHRPNDLADLELHQLVHDLQPDTDAQREQPFPSGAYQLTERFLNLP